MCIGIWKDHSGPALQTLNLLAVTGFMVAPLLVKPFLGRQVLGLFTHNGTSLIVVEGRDVDNKDTPYDSQLLPAEVRNRTSLNEALGTPFPAFFETARDFGGSGSDGNEINDFTVSDPIDGHTPYVFVLVAFYSLIVGLFMVELFFLDLRRRSSVSQPEITKSIADELLNDNTDPGRQPCEYDTLQPSTRHSPTVELEVTAAEGPGADQRFTLKVSLLFFVFNFFYSGIEIGYAGLVMTFAVKYLGWTKDDGTNVTALVQGTNVLLTAIAVVMARYVRPQVSVG